MSDLRHPEIDKLIKEIHEKVYDQGRSEGMTDFKMKLYIALMEYVNPHNKEIRIQTDEMLDLMCRIENNLKGENR